MQGWFRRTTTEEVPFRCSTVVMMSGYPSLFQSETRSRPGRWFEKDFSPLISVSIKGTTLTNVEEGLFPLISSRVLICANIKFYFCSIISSLTTGLKHNSPSYEYTLAGTLLKITLSLFSPWLKNSKSTAPSLS